MRLGGRAMRRVCVGVAIAIGLVVVIAGPVAPANAAGSAVTARFQLPAGFYSVAPGLGSMWVARTDEADDTPIFRIDPATNTMTRVTDLRFPGAAMKVGYGSLWVTDYYGNAVFRVSPRGRVLARIPTGLQPEAIHMAFGSVWIANHHGHSMTRIDPATNTVIATLQVGKPHTFRDGPQGIASGAGQVFVGSSNLLVLQSVDPATNTVTTPSGGPSDDQFCSALHFVRGYVWSADVCSNVLYQHALDGSIVNSLDYTPSGHAVLDSTPLDGELWVSVDYAYDFDTFTGSHGVLEEHNARTGALDRTVRLGGDVSGVTAGFGSLWVFNGVTHALRRISVS